MISNTKTAIANIRQTDLFIVKKTPYFGGLLQQAAGGKCALVRALVSVYSNQLALVLGHH